jgi:flagellar hook assembly protein FlgD
MPGSEEIFSYTGDFEIIDMIVANSSSAVAVNMPTAFGLSAAYPNPFNPSTSFSLHVPMEGNVNVQVYDLSGRAVTTLLSGVQAQGDYNLTWNASEQASGMYLVKAETADAVSVQKVLLLK